MKRILYCLFLGSVGIFSTAMMMFVPETEEVETILQSYSYTRAVNEPVVPYYVEQEVVETILSMPEVQIVDPGVYPSNGVSWLIGLTDEGTPEIMYETYETTYNSEGEVISRIMVPYSNWIQESTPKIYSYGSSVEVGAYFTSRRSTSYGADCYGCSGAESGYSGTSSGIQLSTTAVRQSDGTWKEGITYDGYYLIAADKSLPLCTVVEISNHRWSGQGLTPGEPFLALVVDRGGAVTGSAIDLFTGSESYPTVYNGKRSGVRVEIVDFGRWTRNSQGQRMCRVTSK